MDEIVDEQKWRVAEQLGVDPERVEVRPTVERQSVLFVPGLLGGWSAGMPAVHVQGLTWAEYDVIVDRQSWWFMVDRPAGPR